MLVRSGDMASLTAYLMDNCCYSRVGLGEGSSLLSSASHSACGVYANLSFVDAARAAEILRLMLTPGD
jgi:hypothetical protein